MKISAKYITEVLERDCVMHRTACLQTGSLQWASCWNTDALTEMRAMENVYFSVEIKGIATNPQRNSISKIECSLGRLVSTYTPAGNETILDRSALFKSRDALESRLRSDGDNNELRMEAIRLDLVSFVDITAFKTIDLSTSIIRAINERRFLIAGVLTRSLVEQAAATCFLHDVALSEQASYFPSGHARLVWCDFVVRSFTYGGDFDWTRDYGDFVHDQKWLRQDSRVGPCIKDMIAALEEFAQKYSSSKPKRAVQRFYSALSEWVHPASMGAMVLYGDHEEDFHFRFTQRKNDDNVQFALSHLLTPIHISLAAVEQKITELSSIDFSVESIHSSP